MERALAFLFELTATVGSRRRIFVFRLLSIRLWCRMPELPEVEVLRRHLAGAIRNKVIRNVEVRRARVLRPTSVQTFVRTLTGGKFTGLTRRGKYLLFSLETKKPLLMLGNL